MKQDAPTTQSVVGMREQAPRIAIHAESLECCARTMQKTGDAGVAIDDQWVLHFRSPGGRFWYTLSSAFGG